MAQPKKAYEQQWKKSGGQSCPVPDENILCRKTTKTTIIYPKYGL